MSDARPTGPLRVAVVVPRYPVPSHTFVYGQVRGLLDRGARVSIVAEAPGEPDFEPVDFREEELAGIHVLTPIPAAPLRRLAGAAVQAARAPLGPAVRTLRPGWGREAWSLRHFHAAAGLRRLPPVDVLHCHFGPVGRSFAALRQAGAVEGAVVTTFHGYDVSDTLRRRGPGHYAPLFRHGDLFLPISERWRERLVEIGAPPGRTQVHRMGVATERIAHAVRRPGEGEPLRLLSIARLVEKKGIEYAIRGVAEASGRVDVRYDIYGDGPLRPSLERLAGELGASAVVRFHGWTAHDAVVRRLGGYHALLAPSVTGEHGDQEGIPLAIMEAMAAGLPVISTLHSGIPELVTDGRSGVLLAERDDAAIARTLVDWARSPGRVAELSRAARADVVRDFDLGRLNDALWRRFQALRRPASAGATSAAGLS